VAAPGRISVNVGAATYQGYSALGAQIGYLSPGGGYNFSGGMSQSAGKPVGRVSVGFTF
jgi:autotransporter adhesin